MQESYGEIITVCPYCNGFFVKAVKCDICNGYIDEEYIKTKDGRVICKDCYTLHNILEEY